MRILIFLLIGLGIAAGLWYFMLNQQGGLGLQIEGAQSDTQQKADDYRKNQEEMMRQMGQ